MSKGRRRVGRGSTMILLVLAGCAHSHRHRGGCCGPAAGDTPAMMVTPVVARGTIVPGLDGLAPFAVLEESLNRERHIVPTYRELGARDCQCLAARASS